PPARSPGSAASNAKAPAHVRSFSSGPNEVYLHALVPGVQVIAGTVLGHVGAGVASGDQAGEAAPHILFQIRPAGLGAPLIDPKPILDGWVALEDTSIFRAKGENPFLATSPTVGQVLLESKQQLEPQVLHDSAVKLGACAREDVQEGRVEVRVLAMLEYLAMSELKPTVSGLPCAGSAPAALAANAPASASTESVNITAINGVPVAGHEGPGTLADEAVRKLLMLQGLARPRRIVSLMSYPGAAVAFANPSVGNAIRVSFAAPAGKAGHATSLLASGLTPGEWIELVDRLGEIPDPTVPSGHSTAAIADASGGSKASAKEGPGGND
ncbi:MAG: hypothetical protein ACRDJX_04245, partial [Solirubrobacteraceae bacterium]